MVETLCHLFVVIQNPRDSASRIIYSRRNRVYKLNHLCFYRFRELCSIISLVETTDSTKKAESRKLGICLKTFFYTSNNQIFVLCSHTQKFHKQIISGYPLSTALQQQKHKQLYFLRTPHSVTLQTSSTWVARQFYDKMLILRFVSMM